MSDNGHWGANLSASRSAGLPRRQPHWATKLKAENEALKAALDAATLALRVIPQSRLDKYQHVPDTNEVLAYRKAVYEIDLLAQAKIAEINASLAEAGL